MLVVVDLYKYCIGRKLGYTVLENAKKAVFYSHFLC